MFSRCWLAFVLITSGGRSRDVSDSLALVIGRAVPAFPQRRPPSCPLLASPHHLSVASDNLPLVAMSDVFPSRPPPRRRHGRSSSAAIIDVRSIQRSHTYPRPGSSGGRPIHVEDLITETPGASGSRMAAASRIVSTMRRPFGISKKRDQSPVVCRAACVYAASHANWCRTMECTLHLRRVGHLYPRHTACVTRPGRPFSRLPWVSTYPAHHTYALLARILLPPSSAVVLALSLSRLPSAPRRIYIRVTHLSCFHHLHHAPP